MSSSSMMRFSVHVLLAQTRIKMAAADEDLDPPVPGIEAILASPFGVSPLESDVPALCTEEESIMGIDEAGRGPVLGEVRERGG